MGSKTRILLAWTLFFLASSLRSEQQKVLWKGRIEKGDGFAVVKNPEQPMYSESICILEEEITWGGINETRKEFIFSNIKELDADENGNLYILDVNNKEIKVIDKNGIYSHSIGSVGQGPGEFQFPWSLFVLDQEQIIVVDIMHKSLIFYTLDGKFNRRMSTVSYGNCTRAEITSRGEIIAEFPVGAGFALTRFNPEFEKIETIAAKEREKMPLLQKLTPKIIWCLDNKDRIIWGDSEKYEMNICDGRGKTIQRIVKPFHPIRIRESEYKEEINKKFGGRPIPPIVEQSLPKFYPAFQSIKVDETGRIIVKTFEKNKAGEFYYDIFDREGRYLSRIPLNSDYQVWKNNRLYAIEFDKEEGTQLIKRYKVSWLRD